MKACEHEFENANCTNCANGLPCSAYECAKTQGKLKEYCHEKAEEIHNKYYQQGRADKYQEIVSEYMLLTEKQVAEIRAAAIDECIEILRESYPIIDNEDILYGFSCAIHRMEQLKEQK